MPTRQNNVYRRQNQRTGSTSLRYENRGSVSPRRPAESYRIYNARIERELAEQRSRAAYNAAPVQNAYRRPDYINRNQSSGSYDMPYMRNTMSLGGSYTAPRQREARLNEYRPAERPAEAPRAASDTMRRPKVRRSGRAAVHNSVSAMKRRRELTASAAPADVRAVPVKILTDEERAAARRKAGVRVRFIAAVLCAAMLFSVLLYRETAIFGKNREIDALNSRLSSVLVTNEGIQSGIDKSIELGNLESVAKNKLGMINPDSSQIFYIDMGAGDEVIKASSK